MSHRIRLALVSAVLTICLIIATVGIWSGWDKGEYGDGFKWALTALLGISALFQLKWGADKYCEPKSQ